MKIFALTDCNNFYVSCEKVFNPSLKHTAVVVLSNNDGCVVSRSGEAKKLGIPMGVPFFKIKDLVLRKNVKAFSSNYALYGDMSARIMNILAQFVPDLEIYSIDEAFLDFTGFENSITEHSNLIRKKVLQYTGVPVSIGIGETKTLAKIANNIAKSENTSGIFSFINLKNRDEYLKNFPVEKIWGIGKRSALYLKARGISTAFQLKKTPFFSIKSKMGVMGEKIIDELNCRAAYELETEPTQVKGIRSSRTFPKAVKDKDLIKEAIATYASRAGLKLRQQKLRAGFMIIFLKTDRFQPLYNKISKTISFDIPESNTSLLIKAASSAVDEIYKKGLLYKKAGIILGDLSNDNKTQLSLFGDRNIEKSDNLMRTLDRINNRFGKNTLKFGSCGLSGKEEWRIRCEHKSPAYTTDWNDLPEVG